MLDHTDPAARAPAAASLDATPDNAMRVLSRLALGPVNTDYYLAVFDRFDNTGRTTTSWNWAASVNTVNWMVFRQLWSASLVYLAAAEGVALALYALGRSLLQWPLGVEVGVLGAFAMLAFVVPGLYGNAILYADIRKRVSKALAASRTLPEACAVLQKQASTRKRLQAVAIGNGVLVAAAALGYLLWSPSPSPEARPLALGPSVTVAQARASAASAASAASPPPPASTTASGLVAATPELAAEPAAPGVPSKPSGATAEPPASAAVPPPPLATPAPGPAQGSAPASAPLAPTSSPVAAAGKTLSAPAGKASAPRTKGSTPAETAPAPLASSTATAAASEPVPRPAPAAKAKPKPLAKSSPAPSATAASSATAAVPASPDPLARVGSAAGYYINVGLFADEANARKAQARLLNEGLPAFRQELDSGKGRRIRVRVGPYSSLAQAQEAAASIRAMSLEAVVFKR